MVDRYAFLIYRLAGRVLHKCMLEVVLHRVYSQSVLLIFLTDHQTSDRHIQTMKEDTVRLEQVYLIYEDRAYVVLDFYKRLWIKLRRDKYIYFFQSIPLDSF